MTTDVIETGAGISAIYADKPSNYFGNARSDIVALLPTGQDSWILELGCGSGGTGRAARAAGKAGHYVGIELSAQAAAAARDGLDEVLVGDVATVDLSDLAGRFDALIVSEVLEHLTDPWRELARLAACLKPGAFVAASSPNVSDRRVLWQIARGKFDYQESGVMDRTHLRWFTPQSYRAMFEQAGIEVISLRPICPPGRLGKLLISLSGGRLAHMFMTQMMVIGRKR